jgi:hypothetical protein
VVVVSISMGESSCWSVSARTPKLFVVAVLVDAGDGMVSCRMESGAGTGENE